MNETLLLFILAIIGFIAGVINTIAGGGSLLTLPMLIFMGLPPAVANGTNRIGIFIQSISSIAGFRSKGVKPGSFGVYLGISALVGSLIGAQIAIDIKGETFNKILAIVMVIVVLFMVFKPKVNLQDVIERTQGKHFWISILAFFFIGVYGGFIQAGVGIFILLALTSINYLNLVTSNAVKVLVVFIYTIGALAIFVYNNQIDYLYGFVLATGNATGGWIASRWSVKKGDGLVKVFLIIMVIAMAIKLWIDS
ncbi:putative membrane protein YfcA [Aquimarina sp. EL_43]|uniref:sulfite exporter TauE/SafE family protein n=1 Tax=Aquimarina TaxID=290174 RepID=UPI000471CBEA|nr:MULTISPECIES: sulfite exporter TauE/SafE family protein [Aquimarina]MBG6129371.1 putative membrane protein YfcA [Aquimarina sp. EL_35]MBG6150436.1 putative membrane protein YfcA [Aquimarina sp. EL_32]MBG6168256.1 putative membrane protein YfcA [Aquimarina sp. EL_43]